ncbi:unnamed protein product [Oppiella nova]|uniref:Uncharacterized protein n=1 Tax=Oppiella nova TaxID=334625 RepID=A0A7R9MH63_9ACAR|nr:unnamed protein product [Oppiella nova]CAG2177191.1 unnamed protein product [Oppiella nova]
MRKNFILKTFQTKGRKSQKKSDLESGRVAEEDYAFDNPYFEDEEDLKTKPQTHSQTNTIISLQVTYFDTLSQGKVWDERNGRDGSDAFEAISPKLVIWMSSQSLNTNLAFFGPNI